MSDFKADQSSIISGHKLVYNRQGSGQTILFVHGITTYSFIWRNLVRILRNSYDVISVDLLGCGNSDKLLDISYSLKQHAKILHEFIKKLNLGKFHFVSHDVGGGIGQIFAINHSERLLRLTMINTVAYDFWPVQPIIAIRTPIIRQLAMASLDFGTFKLIIKRGLFYKKKATSELMDYFWKPMITKDGRKAFLHFAKCLNNNELLEIADDLKKLSIPVLIIRGDADVYLSAQICEKLNNEIPNSKLIRIPDGGHFIQEDVPGQLVEHIERFFKEIKYGY